jgi:hypothetical protein
MNAASANKLKITIKQMLDIGINGLCGEMPIGRKMITPPFGGVTLCKTWNLIRLFFYQLILSTVIDFVLKIKGKRPK